MMKFQLALFVATSYLAEVWSTQDFSPTQHGYEELLVIDTDAGADDAMAISLVLNGTTESDYIAGITCVRGNTGVHNVSKNVLRTLRVNRRLNIPVMEGSDFGLLSTSDLDYYYGEDGFGDFDYPVPDIPLQAEHSAVFLSNIVRSYPGKVTILSLGPLTNLAVAGVLYPNFYKDVRRIIFLGGSTAGHGAMEGGIEFNVWADAVAARAVFSRSPLENPITIIPSETLRFLRYPWGWRKNTLGAKGTDVINLLNLAESKTHKNPKGWKVDDPTAAAVYLYPEIVLNTYLGVPNLTPNGTMTVNRIYDESTNQNSPDVGYVRVVASVNKEKLKQILFDLL